MKEIYVIIEKLKESLAALESKIDSALKDIDKYQQEIDNYNKKIDELKETIEIDKTNKINFEAKIEEAEAFAKSVEEVVPLMKKNEDNVEENEDKKSLLSDLASEDEKETKDDFGFKDFGFDPLNQAEEKDKENNVDLPFLNTGAPVFDEKGFDISEQALGANESYNRR